MNKVFKKIAELFEGNKRRIALLGALVSEATPEHTIAHWIGKGVFILFGTADVAGVVKEKLQNKFIKR